MTAGERAGLRTVVLAGHAGSGKTTLAEHLLHRTGAVPRLGSVDDGTASMDSDPEEQRRHLSLSLHVAAIEHDDHRIVLLDTPGYADFIGEMISGIGAADAAIVCVDAAGGVEAGTAAALGTARLLERSTLFLLTRCDRETADPLRTLDLLRAELGPRVAPLQIPIGSGEELSGVVDLVHRRAWLTESGVDREVPIPDELADEVTRRREQLLEAAAEVDDDLMARYLDGAEIPDADLDAAIHRGVRDRLLSPVLIGSAARDVGVAGLLDAIVRYLPSAEEEPPVHARDGAGGAADLPPAVDGPLLLQVFKTTADPFVGRLSWFRVWSGTLRAHDVVWNPARLGEERIGQILAPRGRELVQTGEIRAGEIGAVAKLTVTATGDSLSSRAAPYALAPLVFPEPSLPIAVEPASKADLDRLGQALNRLVEEDPSLRLERPVETGEQILWAQGESQIAVAGERLKRKFGTAIITHAPHVPYRETIRGRARTEGRHKKQTGGRGQFGHVWLEIEPNPGGGVVFADRVVGGVVPRGFFPGVEKGVRDVAERGPIAGYPVVDLRATLVDGSFHEVDSDETSFRIAAQLATRRGIEEATPVLLEPIMALTIRVPDAAVGDVSRDLSGRRGRLLGVEGADGWETIQAHVPQAELFTYATELRSLTAGRGTFHAQLDRYEEVPPHVAQRVIAQARRPGDEGSGR